jgi:hypothetical protein
MPLLYDGAFFIERHNVLAPCGEIDIAIELIEHALDDVVFDLHAVGRDVVSADTVEIALPDLFRGLADMTRDNLDDRLNGEYALRSAIAAESGVGGDVGLAGIAGEPQIRQPVAIVHMAQRACQHRWRMIGDIAPVGRHYQIEPFDCTAVVEADVIPEIEWMPLAGGAHIVIARQPQLHRPASFPGQHRGNAGDDGRLTFLAAKAAAHPPNLTGDGIERNTEEMRYAVLHFRRMLRRGEDVHVVAFPGRCDGDLPFQIEVVLPAAAQFARQTMPRIFQCSIDVAACHDLRRNQKLLTLDRLFDREDRIEYLIVDLHKPGPRPGLIERRRGNGDDRLPFIFHNILRQQRLVGADRANIVLAGNIFGGNDSRNTRQSQCRRRIDSADTRMCMRAEHQCAFKRALHARDIVEIKRAAADMTGRAVMPDRYMNTAVNASEGSRHSDQTCTACIDVVSACNRRTRLAAARKRYSAPPR